MTSIPATVPPLPKAVDHKRDIPVRTAFNWLAFGWRDLWTRPGLSLVYGLGVVLVSALVIWSMFWLGWAQVLFPALAGFLVVGPVLAIGLYEKSRLLEAGKSVSLGDMLVPRHGSAQHILFVGAILSLLMMVWMRAAVLLYALFWGWRPFPGMDHLLGVLIGTPVGLSMLFVGTCVGALFAALAFAISVFSLPLVLDQKLDAFTAMGTSMSYVWNNLPVMLLWGAIVLTLTALSLITGLLGLIIVFPWLGHATWHAYRTICQTDTRVA